MNKKTRHNEIERNRVTRMNDYFNQLKKILGLQIYHTKLDILDEVLSRSRKDEFNLKILDTKKVKKASQKKLNKKEALHLARVVCLKSSQVIESQEREVRQVVVDLS
jgi:hypothetical protein